MREGRIVGFGAPRASEMRCLHVITAADILGPVPTVGTFALAAVENSAAWSIRCAGSITNEG